MSDAVLDQFMTARSGGCHGDYHEPRPYAGDPPFHLAFFCYCGLRVWRIEACPTCGRERAVSA